MNISSQTLAEHRARHRVVERSRRPAWTSVGQEVHYFGEVDFRAKSKSSAQHAAYRLNELQTQLDNLHDALNLLHRYIPEPTGAGTTEAN